MRVSASLAAAICVIAFAAVATGCAGSAPDASAPVPVDAAPASSGMKITDVKPGTGISPKPGQTCVVHYTGWLYENGVKGRKFDSSFDRRAPFSFVLGEHRVIEGWERGVATMRVGGKRTLIIPPELGYGSAGSKPAIPPNATLMFDVELLDVRAGS